MSFKESPFVEENTSRPLLGGGRKCFRLSYLSFPLRVRKRGRVVSSTISFRDRWKRFVLLRPSFFFDILDDSVHRSLERVLEKLGFRMLLNASNKIRIDGLTQPVSMQFFVVDDSGVTVANRYLFPFPPNCKTTQRFHNAYS